MLRRILALVGVLGVLAAPAWALPAGGWTSYSSAFAPATHVCTGTETVPNVTPGPTQLVIVGWGGGEGGAPGTPFNPGPPASGPFFGAGGISGAMVQKTLTLTSADYGKTFICSVGAAGPGGSLGGNTTIANGTDSQTVSLTAHASNGSSAPTATGGDVNTSGNLAGTPPIGGVPIVDAQGDSAGGGGMGTFAGGAGNPGGAGQVLFYYK